MLPGTVINEERKRLYYEKGYWSTRTVYDCFLESVKKYPDSIAFVDRDNKYSYEKLHRQVLKVSINLQHQLDIKKGDFVSVQLPNWTETVIIYLACTRIGAIYNPIPATARYQEVKYILTLCESKVFFVPESFRNFNYIAMTEAMENEIELPNVVIVKGHKAYQSFIPYEALLSEKHSESEELPESVNADDPLVVLFTSGTESNPKGVVHTHNTVLFTAHTMGRTLGVTHEDAVIMPSPISHASGYLQGVNLPLTVGAKSVLVEHFTAQETLELIGTEKCSFSMGATPFLHDIIEEILKNEGKYDLSHFRFFLCGGAPIPRHLVTKAKKLDFKVLAVFGSSESPPHTVSRLEDSEEWIVGYDGKPLPNVEVKIVDQNNGTLAAGEIGEEVSRGPNVFIGYYKHPELTEQYLDRDGWYYSGDLCVLYPNQYIKVVGRKKDIIIRGGQNISPSEVEDILYQHPKVRHIAIIGIPDERMGERALAVVVPNKGEVFTFEEMIDYLARRNIAKYKYPEKLELLDELPTTPSGKIQKFRLREHFMRKR